MSNSHILKAIETLSAKCIQLEARCAALDAALCVVAMKQGIPKEKIGAAIDKLTEHCHQKRLEQIEDIDPGIAAALDCRSQAPDLFD